MKAGVDAANSRRLWVQSAVSLYVDLPLSYESKIGAVDGVDTICKMQWFGGLYQDRSNFFAQFAVDTDEIYSYVRQRVGKASGQTQHPEKRGSGRVVLCGNFRGVPAALLLD